jgi:hypothetical protein
MKLEVLKKNDTKIEIMEQSADSSLKYYNKKLKKIQNVDWLPDTQLFPNKSACFAVLGSPGSGKSTFVTSVLTAKNKKNRIYSNVFDKIILFIPESTLHSIIVNPYESLPEEQIFHEYNEDFLDYILESCERDSLELLDTCVYIDDAASSLKSNAKMISKLNNLICKHRHLRLTIFLCLQDQTQLSLSARQSISCVINFSCNNVKRLKLFHEEYLPDITFKEYMELQPLLYKKKGDFLGIRLDKPPVYFSNFDMIKITSE